MNHSRHLQDSHDKDTTPKEENGIIYVWGNNNHGQLGLGDSFLGKTYSAPRPLSLGFFIQEVACGEDHAVFLTSRGQIYTAGSNAEGRLGIGNKSLERSSSPILIESASGARCIQIACGWAHTLSIMDSGEVFSWGAGESGALGLGTTDSAWSPKLVILEDKAFLGTRKVAAGSAHSAFISELGTIYVCGAGDAGQLGTGKRDKELKPVQMTLISEKARDVACGVFHTLILTERGKVYAAGGNIFGQLGLGNKKSTNIPIRVKDLDYLKITKVACGHHSAALTETGEIYVWGTGVFGEYVSPMKFSQEGKVYKDVNVNGFFGVALDHNNHVWTWGSNNNGELGQGHYDPKLKPYLNEALQDKKIERYACGVSFVIALGETTGRNRRITPLRLRTQTVPQPDMVPLSNRTPQKVEGQIDVTEGRLAATMDVSKAKLGTRQTLRTSSVGKPRDGNYESTASNRRGLNSRVRESGGGFIDLMGRGPGEEGKKEQKGEIDDIGLIEKLLRQKETLEKALSSEKAEKKVLEQNLGELKQRVMQIQEGPDGLSGLNENFNRQTRKFDELKNVYEEETRRREKVIKELHQEQQNGKELARKIVEKDEMINKLQVKADQGEMSKKRVTELEGIRQRMTQQLEALENSNQQNLLELNRQKTRQTEIEKLVVHKSEIIQRLEAQGEVEASEKKELEKEIREMSVRIQEVEGRLERSQKSWDREKELRAQVEEELKIVKYKEEGAREQIQQLMAEMENMRAVFDKKLEEERESRAKVQEDVTMLEQGLNDFREENMLLNDEKAALEDELLESQQKNRRLLELLNQEIDKQNQSLNKKSGSFTKSNDIALPRPARQREEGQVHDVLPVKAEERKSPSRLNKLEAYRNEKVNVFGKTENTATPTGEAGNFMFRSVERSQYLPHDTSVDLKQSRAFETPKTEEFRLEYGSFGSPMKENRQSQQQQQQQQQQQRQEIRTEDRTRKVSVSPNKRQSGLDVSVENSRNIVDTSNLFGQTEQSRVYTPEKERGDITREIGSHSGTKMRSASPNKNFSIADYRSRGSEMSESKDFLEDLKEVQEKMEALERNKRELQSRMQDFETRFAVGEDNK